jgi:hypothetical protein
MEAGSKAAFESNNCQFDIMNECMQRVESGHERLETGIQSILNLLQAMQQAPPAAAAVNNAPAVGVPAAAAGAQATEGGKFVVFLSLPITASLHTNNCFYYFISII